MSFGFTLAAGGTQVEKQLFTVLLQLGVIILVARTFAMLFRWMRQPAVVGEIVAGIVLGPSILGKLEAAGLIPPISAQIFDPSAGPVMSILAQLGLVLLLFLIGLEFDFSHLKSCGRAAGMISIAGVALPFFGGIALGYGMHPHLESHVSKFGFVLFLGTAMSITALPILGRMMMEMKISRAKTSAVTITAAAIDDATGWILLAAVSAIATAHYHPMNSVLMIGLTLGFAAVMLLIVRPVMRRWIRWIMDRNDRRLSPNALAVVLTVLFLCAMATSKIGIFAIFGAFLLGAVLSTEHHFRDAIHATFGQFVTVFFLPVFFTYTGLRTDIGTLGSGAMWLMAGLVSAVAIAGKLGGCTLAARLGGLPGRQATCIGILMNTRALMELVVVNVGYDLGVIPRSVFCMLVMMAVLTTVMTTPLLLRFARGTDLELGLLQSGFLQPALIRRPAEVAATQRA